jgi:capsid portal protein
VSDKKQPAQQRVNVRIVKADDPEQRGGMKPIAKADGSLQISPEEAYTAGVWAKPPFDLRGLSKMVDESTILPQCIRAYKSNIAGFGIDIRYKDDFADANETHPGDESGMGPGGGSRRDAQHGAGEQRAL